MINPEHAARIDLDTLLQQKQIRPETFCLPKSRIPEIPLPEKVRFEEVNLVMKGVRASCAG